MDIFKLMKMMKSISPDNTVCSITSGKEDECILNWSVDMSEETLIVTAKVHRLECEEDNQYLGELISYLGQKFRVIHKDKIH